MLTHRRAFISLRSRLRLHFIFIIYKTETYKKPEIHEDKYLIVMDEFAVKSFYRHKLLLQKV